MKTTKLQPPTGERLEPFRRKIDGYVIGPKSRSVICGTIHPFTPSPTNTNWLWTDYMLTGYLKEAEKLYERGWLSVCQNVGDMRIKRYRLSPAGERIREQIYDE